MNNLIVTLIILGILSLSVTKIIIEKHKGVKCVGCPHSGTSASKNSGCSCSGVSDIKLK